MGKKDKHREKKNIEQTPIEKAPKKPVYFPAAPVKFDEIFSSALQQMRNDPSKSNADKGEDLPVLQMPTRQDETAEDVVIWETTKHQIADAYKDEVFDRTQAADVHVQKSQKPERTEKEILAEFLRTFSDSPLNSVDISAAAKTMHDGDTYGPVNNRKSAFSEAPAEPKQTEPKPAEQPKVARQTDTSENMFTVPKAEDTGRFEAPEFFTVPQAEDTGSFEAPEFFTVPQMEDTGSFEAPEFFTVPQAEDTGRFEAPEFFTVPQAEDTGRFEAPETFTVPDILHQADAIQTPEVFTVPEMQKESDAAVPLEKFAVPQILREDTTHTPEAFKVPELLEEVQLPEEPYLLPEEETEKHTPELKVKKQFHLFRRKKNMEAAEEFKQEQQWTKEHRPEEQSEEQRLEQQQPETQIQEDTTSLLSVVQSLLGGTDTEETSPAEPVPSESVRAYEKQPKQAMLTAGDTIRFTAQPEVRNDTYGKASKNAAKQTAPTQQRTQQNLEDTRAFTVKEEHPQDFWNEFESLKRLVGALETVQTEAIETLLKEVSVTEKNTEQTVPVETPQPLPQRQKEIDKPQTETVSAKQAREVPARSGKAKPAVPEHPLPRKKGEAAAKELTEKPHMIQSAGARSVKASVEAAALAQPHTTVPKEHQTTKDSKRQTRGETAQTRQRHTATMVKPDAEVQPEVLVETAYKSYTKKQGSTGARFAASVVVTLLSLFLTIYASAGWNFLPQKEDLAITSYLLIALLFVTIVLAFDVFVSALKKLKNLQFSMPLLVALSVIFTVIDAFLAAADRVPFCTAASILIVFLLWDKYNGVVGMMTTLRVLQGVKNPTGIVEVHDIMKGRVGLSRAEGSVADFMDKYEKAPPTDKLIQFYVPISAVVSTVLPAVIASKIGVSFTWTACLLLFGSIPLVGIINFNRLFCILAKRLSDSDAALCGWYGAQTFGGDHAVFVNDSDLFPEKNIKFNGIKVLTRDADRVIGYAAAIAKATGSVLYPLFEEELRSRNARHYRVERYRFYENGDIGASISGDIVLMGTLDFMKRMGVHMAGGVRIKQAIYTSVNGELAAVFAIKYSPKESVRRGLTAIAENRHFRTIFVTRDFLLTPEMIRDKYEISLNNTVYPSTKERHRLSEAEFKKKGKQGALLAEDAFGSFADAAAGGRVLNSAVRGCIILALLNGIIGIGLMSVLAYQSGFDAATAINLLLYQLSWLIPTLLLTSWTQRY